MMTYPEAGKGSAPRKARDDAAYASGWERIFGNQIGNQILLLNLVHQQKIKSKQFLTNYSLLLHRND